MKIAEYISWIDGYLKGVVLSQYKRGSRPTLVTLCYKSRTPDVISDYLNYINELDDVFDDEDDIDLFELNAIEANQNLTDSIKDIISSNLKGCDQDLVREVIDQVQDVVELIIPDSYLVQPELAISKMGTLSGCYLFAKINGNQYLIIGATQFG
jgi:hypothetical protein